MCIVALKGNQYTTLLGQKMQGGLFLLNINPKLVLLRFSSVKELG
jgi:hypothetical protein